MTDTIQFELVSPEKRLMSQAVEMVTLPGTEGDFGVLAGHAPLISALRPGVIAIQVTEGAAAEMIFTAGGFVEVRPDRLIVLAEQAVPIATLKRGEIEQALRDLGEDLTAAKDEIERAHITIALAIAEAQLAVAA